MSTHNVRPETIRTTAEVHRRRQWREVLAFTIAGIGILFALALFSFTPSDLPQWMPFSKPAVTEAGVSNFIGPIGAIIAGVSFAAFGMAGYLIPLLFLWAGFAVLKQIPLFGVKTAAFTLLLLVSTASLIYFQGFGQSWVDSYNVPGGVGGVAGSFVGGTLVLNTIGNVGGAVLMSIAALVSTVCVAGFHPFLLIELMRQKFRGERVEIVENHGPFALENISLTSITPRDSSQAQSDTYTNFNPETDELHLEPEPEPIIILSKGQPTEVEEEPLQVHQVEGIQVTADPAMGVVNPTADPVHPAQAPVETVYQMPANAEQPFVQQAVPQQQVPAPAPGISPEVFAASAAQGQRSVAPIPQATVDAQPIQAAPVVPAVPARPMMGRVIDATARRSPSELCSKQDRLSPHSPQFRDYKIPSFGLLEEPREEETPLTDQVELQETQALIIETLKTFGLQVSPGDITRGPTITRYEIYPSEGMRVKQIVALEADLARATKAECINILAPIPGKDTVGIEIANHRKVVIPLRQLLEDPLFGSAGAALPIALGKDVYGKTIIADLAAMPHLLVAGATGSGKSVCINSIIVSLLYRFTPDELRIIMIDPKVVEMQVYHSLPHLAVPVVTEPKKVLMALQWCINEMERRYELFARVGCRKLEEFNKQQAKKKEPSTDPATQQMRFEDLDEEALAAEPMWEEDEASMPGSGGRVTMRAPNRDQVPDFLPHIVVIIDELADLMQTAPANVETSINRLCQKARAAGIHLIVATQSPRVDVVTGLIKANIPARIAFQVSSATDSRVILDKAGADKLVGKGDMLYQPPDQPISVRAQGAFLTDQEVSDVVDACSNQATPVFDANIEAALAADDDEEPEAGASDLSQSDEDTLQKCVDVIVAERKASTSYLQRRLRIGYTRAARMMDILEERGIVGPGDGAKPREILVGSGEFDEVEPDPAAVRNQIPVLTPQQVAPPQEVEVVNLAASFDDEEEDEDEVKLGW